jgi:serine/threonine protein kinase
VRQQAPSPIPQSLHAIEQDELEGLPTPHIVSQPLPQGHRHFVFPDKPMQTSLAVGTMLGAYRLERLLGVGAFSQVYLATQDESMFAIKTIQKGKLFDDPRVRSSIEREVGILKVKKKKKKKKKLQCLFIGLLTI